MAARARQTIEASFVVVDEFLKFEERQRLLGQPVDPAITATANALRVTYPPANQLAWQVLKEYRADPRTETRTALERALLLLANASAQAQQALTQLRSPP